MVAYSIFLNLVEVFTLTTFVYLYYSLESKKTFILLFCCLFFGFELCDILRQNGILLMFLNFCISYGFILYKKRNINFGDIFILAFYIFSMNLIAMIIFHLFSPLLANNNKVLFIVLAGLTSKILLILFTIRLIKHLNYEIVVPNKQYFLVIITEIIVLSIFGLMGYAVVNPSVTYSEFIVCTLLLAVFVLIIINGIYLNRIYMEKMQYEKQLQKRKIYKTKLNSHTKH